MPQVREAGRKKRKWTEKGVQGGPGPERGEGEHAQPQKARSPIHLTGTAERNGGPDHDPKTGGDQGKCNCLIFPVSLIW